jgi:putative aminopeptidase FrvX
LAGIPTVSVSVPHRYTHSPVSISRVDDWKNTLALLHAVLKKDYSSAHCLKDDW